MASGFADLARTEHTVAIFFGNHVGQNVPEALHRFGAGVAIRVGKSLALAFRQAPFQFVALFSQFQQSLTAVTGTFALLDKTFPDELSQNA